MLKTSYHGEKTETKAADGTGAQVIKLASGTVTPGLIDAHTHLLKNALLLSDWSYRSML